MVCTLGSKHSARKHQAQYVIFTMFYLWFLKWVTVNLSVEIEEVFVVCECDYSILINVALTVAWTVIKYIKWPKQVFSKSISAVAEIVTNNICTVQVPFFLPTLRLSIQP